MSSKIRVLNEHTINKIAAGEVIENPASVVKELVENSLDAGATEICVEINGGGRQLIRITDNGCGMNADDAVLCLERHATSKIKDVEDIHEIYTMGFRGEAIPSIAAISKFTLLTRPEDAEVGTMVIVDGGRLLQCVPAACSKGTTIEIKSLFFNVPVRKKFQKSPAYDANEILKMLSLLALGHPNIKFDLISNQENVLSTTLSAKNTFEEALKERITSILGDDFVESTCPMNLTKNEVTLQGFIGLPSNTRHNRTGQYLFINKRGISSPLISYAVRDGYGTVLPTNRHPIYVLHLTLPGSLVDVNVHPQKREVRLRQELELKEMIIKGVEEALQKSGTPFSQEYAPQSTPPSPFRFEPPKFAYEPMKSFAYTPSPIMRETPKPQESPSLFVAQSVETPKESPYIPRVIATIHRFILIDQSLDGLCLVDQKAAHSRVIFERLIQQQKKTPEIPVQSLLIPHTIQLSLQEAGLVRDHVELLNQLGIHIHESGPNSFLIDALPQIFGNTDIQAFIRDLLSNPDNLTRDKEKQIALAASRASVSKNKRMALDEAQSLMAQLMKCENPHHCPLGKAIMAQISQDELIKYFTKG